MTNDGKRVHWRRFCDYMVLRGLSASTQEGYLRSVVGLVRHYRRSPDQLTAASLLGSRSEALFTQVIRSFRTG